MSASHPIPLPARPRREARVAYEPHRSVARAALALVAPRRQGQTSYAIGPDVGASGHRDLVRKGSRPGAVHVGPSGLDPNAACPPFDCEKLAKIATALCGKKDAQVRITPSAKDPGNSPLLVTGFSGLRQGFAVLMPTRHEKRVIEVPTWINRPEQKEAA